MSGISKPLINFTNAVNSSTFIPVEEVIDAVAVNIPAASVGSPTATFDIIFTLFGMNNVVKYVRIHFTTANARDTSLTNFKSANSTAVA